MKVIIRVLCKNVGGCLNSQQGGTIQDTEAEWILLRGEYVLS